MVQLSAGGLALLAVGAVAGEPAALAPAAVSASSLLALGYLVLIDSLAGFALYSWLLRATTVTLASADAYVVPIVAYLCGVLVLGELFHPAVLVGATAIIVAVAAEARANPLMNPSAEHPPFGMYEHRRARLASQNNQLCTRQKVVSSCPVSRAERGGYRVPCDRTALNFPDFWVLMSGFPGRGY